MRQNHFIKLSLTLVSAITVQYLKNTTKTATKSSFLIVKTVRTHYTPQRNFIMELLRE